MSRLDPCPSCQRHVREGCLQCPFCNGVLPRSDERDRRSVPHLPISRVALIFAGATVAACSSSTPTVLGFYGTPVGIDATLDDAGHEAGSLGTSGDAGAK
jgi:hypothetical protein